jgi:hypothetical protein
MVGCDVGEMALTRAGKRASFAQRLAPPPQGAERKRKRTFSQAGLRTVRCVFQSLAEESRLITGSEKTGQEQLPKKFAPLEWGDLSPLSLRRSRLFYDLDY